MSEITLRRPDAPAVAQSGIGTATRLYFADNLRSALMILVVLHHVALVYGASLPEYYYVEPPFTDPRAFQMLLLFTAFNQAWFMGAFFLLSGYFTPRSFDRKGPAAFLKDRLLRLGIPLIAFYFLLSPISFIGWWLMPAELTGITTPLTWESFRQAYPDLIGLGPLWFVAMLLVFSVGYAGWRMLTANGTVERAIAPSKPGYLTVGLFTLALAAAGYLMRMVVPLGESVWQFPSLAYLPQYLSFFVIGVVASRRRWIQTVSRTMGAVAIVVAVVVSIVLFPLAVSGQLFSLELSPALDKAMGNGHWQSAVYALWDAVLAVGLFLGLVVVFRALFNGGGKTGRFLSRHSYTVYIIHIPIIVFLAYALRGIETGSMRKFILASLIIVPVCYVAAYLVRKIPLADRVL